MGGGVVTGREDQFINLVTQVEGQFNKQGLWHSIRMLPNRGN
jgi:hypothetical protein